VNGSLLLDPTASEEALSDGSLLLALQPSSNEVGGVGI
jgi:exosome complex RNA-binding protein Rrp42 (RNase PH superfamily)